MSENLQTRSEIGTEEGTTRLTLKELGSAANVSERTVRYYIQQGLLPPPQGAGPASRYSLEHLSRLALIRRLKAALLPLSEIKQLISGLPAGELVEVAQEFYAELTRTNPVAISVAPPRSALPRSVEPFKPTGAVEVFVVPPEEPAEAAGSGLEAAVLGKWGRLALAPGLELHYEVDGPQDNAPGQEKLHRLLAFAQQLYSD